MADESSGVLAEVGGDLPRGADRQQPIAEHDDDRDRPDQERNPDQRELEEGEWRPAVVLRGARNEEIDVRPRQG